jgi:hypothetical protein
MSRAAPALPAVQARVWRAVMLRVQLNAYGGTRVRSAERAQRQMCAFAVRAADQKLSGRQPRDNLVTR